MSRQNLWHGIDNVHFIYHGDWSDPEVEHDGMVVNSYVVEDSMYERYKEYCEEHNIEGDDDSGFSKYMAENADEVKELIFIAWDSEPKATAEMGDVGEITLRHCDIRDILKGSDVSDICEQPYITEQFKPFTTEHIIKYAEYIADMEYLFSREEAIEIIIDLTAVQLSDHVIKLS